MRLYELIYVCLCILNIHLMAFILKVSSSLKSGEKPSPSGNSYSRNYDPVSRISSSLMNEESTPDATSEKELVGICLSNRMSNILRQS